MLEFLKFDRLLGATSPELEVINAGVVGFLSGQELAYLVTELVDFHPDTIVVYNGWNDLFPTWNGQPTGNNVLDYNSDFFSIEQALVLNYRSQRDVWPALRRLITALSRQSEIVSSLRSWISGDGMRAQAEQRGRPRSEDLVRTAKNYTSSVKKMHDFCEARGMEFLLVIQPELGQKRRRTERENELLAAGVGIGDYAASFPELYEQFRRYAGAELMSSGVSYLDINAEQTFVESHEELFSDVVHTNLACNRLVARLIGVHLEESEP